MRKMFLLGLASGIVLGCYSTLDSFDRRLAKLSCVNYKECQSAEFEAEFDSLGDCQDQLADEFDELFAGCSYDASIGRKCIHAFYKRRKDCGGLDMGTISECSGALTCTFEQASSIPSQHILRTLVASGDPAGGVSADEPIALDPALDEAIEAIE